MTTFFNLKCLIIQITLVACSNGMPDPDKFLNITVIKYLLLEKKIILADFSMYFWTLILRYKE